MANFYIDGTTLSNSTAVFQDGGLTTCSPSGFYSDGIISREQVTSGNTCYLLPQQACASCAEPCGNTINGSGATGLYVLDLDVGGTSTDTGAIIVQFDPFGVPDGVLATYDSQQYNKLSSPIYGLRQSTVANAPTFIGDLSQDCGVQGGTTVTLPVNNFVGGSFVPSGTSQTVVILPGQGQLTGDDPGKCVMVVPKASATPATINVQFFGPCSGTGFSISVDCPRKLTQFAGSSTVQSTVDAACAQGNLPSTGILTEYYHQPVPVGGTQGVPTTNDYVFNDENGVNFPADGWYLHSTGFTYLLTTGIVTATSDSCKTITVTDCKDNNSYTFNERFGTNPGIGQVLEYNKVVGGVTETSHSCGTITSLGSGVTTNGIQKSILTRACDDSTHCPQ